MTSLMLSAAQGAWMGAGLGFLALMYRRTAPDLGHRFASLFVACGAGIMALIVLLGG